MVVPETAPVAATLAGAIAFPLRAVAVARRGVHAEPVHTYGISSSESTQMRPSSEVPRAVAPSGRTVGAELA